MKSIERKQIQLIHIAKGQLGLSDEEYRKLLNERYWADTSKDLSYAEAQDLIDHFKTLGFEIKRKPRPKRPPGIPEMVYPEHPMMRKIEHLRKDVRWHFHDGYKRWLKKCTFLTDGRIKTTKEAAKVIEALKSMKARQQREATSEGGSRGMKHDGNIQGGRTSW